MLRAKSASAADLAAIRVLLEAAGLPTSDLESSRPLFLVIHEGDCLIAAGAVERFGSAGLLRSVVVAEQQRNRGLGQLMVRELERLATNQRIEQLILLTQTAERFFSLAGYRAIKRSEAPVAVQQSEEFRSLCPSSAACMAKALAAPAGQ